MNMDTLATRIRTEHDYFSAIREHVSSGYWRDDDTRYRKAADAATYLARHAPVDQRKRDWFAASYLLIVAMQIDTPVMDALDAAIATASKPSKQTTI